MKTKININKVVKEITNRADRGDFDTVTKFRLLDISVRISNGCDLSGTDIALLKLNGIV